MSRFDRNIRFFGEEGQERLRATHVAIVGVGGLGTHVVQQLGLLGVGRITLIDFEKIDHTNLNRYIGVRCDDDVYGIPKVVSAERLLSTIDPEIDVRSLQQSFVSADGFAEIIQADYVFGCLDLEGNRLILTELCSAYRLPYFDLASDIFPGNTAQYGGTVCFSRDGDGCLVCMGELDLEEAGFDLASKDAR